MINTIKELIEEKKFKSPLNSGKNVFVLAKRLKKKDSPGKFFKTSTDNILFFHRDRIFTIYKKVKLNDNSYLYWLEENKREVKGRFLRHELFALNNQFLG